MNKKIGHQTDFFLYIEYIVSQGDDNGVISYQLSVISSLGHFFGVSDSRVSHIRKVPIEKIYKNPYREVYKMSGTTVTFSDERVGASRNNLGIISLKHKIPKATQDERRSRH